jgi:hypothetical protein
MPWWNGSAAKAAVNCCFSFEDSDWQPISGDGGSYESRDLIALGVP